MGFGGVSNYYAGFRVTTDLVSGLCMLVTLSYAATIIYNRPKRGEEYQKYIQETKDTEEDES